MPERAKVRNPGKREATVTTYLVVSGILFGLIAVVHAMRLMLGWPAQIGGWEVPLWLSWAGLAVPGGLCAWALVLAGTLARRRGAGSG
jgi:hypothetical protein